jgi:hypothetical protein
MDGKFNQVEVQRTDTVVANAMCMPLYTIYLASRYSDPQARDDLLLSNAPKMQPPQFTLFTSRSNAPSPAPPS